MKHLVSVVQRLSLARNLETIMAIVRRAVRDLTGADGATFVLREGDQCYYADEDAISPLWKGQRFAMRRLHQRLDDAQSPARRDRGHLRGSAHSARRLSPDVREEPGDDADPHRGARSAPSARTGPRRHSRRREEVELLQALADSTSIAMEAVDLFTKLERRVAERTEELERTPCRARSARTASSRRSPYSVAHDLRSPLIAIEGFRQVLLESCAHTFDEESREYLARIGSAVTRMHRLIEDLLGLSKVSLRAAERGSPSTCPRWRASW